MLSSGPSWIELSSSALLHNFHCLKKTHPKVGFALKSNAYGHGLVEIYEILRDHLSDTYLFLAYLDEAQILRERGFKGPILQVTPLNFNHFLSAENLGIEILLSSQENLEIWTGLDVKPKAHLKIDTGLSRQGFLWSTPFSKEFLADPRLVGVCTHFANVEDVLEQDFGLTQLSRFENVVEEIKKLRPKILTHAAATAAALVLPASRLDLVRIGISLYGLWPSRLTRLSLGKDDSLPLDLKPVLSWRSRIEQVKEIPSGSFVGYGCSYRTSRPMKIGILPVGYYDGYRRLCGEHQAYVLVRGQRCPLLGRISMNIIVCDLTAVPAAIQGDLVTLVGQSEQEYLSAETFASWSNTIHYEALSTIGAHIEKVITV